MIRFNKHLEEAMRVLYLIPGLVCLFLGGVFLLFFRSSRNKQETIDREITAQTWGRLVDTESRTERDYENRTRTVYYGIYEYDTADGQHVSSAADYSYHTLQNVPGTQGNTVRVLYNPKKPDEFILPEEQAAFKAIWPKFKKTGIGLTVLGAVLTLAAVAAIFGVFDPLFDTLLSQM